MEGLPDRSRWRVIRLDDRVGWEAALQGIGHGMAHTWDYNAAMADSNRDRTLLWVAETGSGRFVCPLAERGSSPDLDIYTPLGFGGIAGWGDVAEYHMSWADFVARRGYVAGYLGLHPVLAPGSITTSPGALATNTAYLLDLADGEDGLLRRMSESTRRRLRGRASREVEISTDRDRLSTAFLRLYPASMAARGAAPVYELTATTLRQLCQIPAVTLYGAPMADPQAVVMLGSSSGGAEYVFGVADASARHLIVSLLWRAMQVCAQQGKEWLNLGGGIRPNDSVAEFKRRLGGRPVPLVDLRHVYDQARFQSLCAEAGVSPDDAYFPPYRAPAVVADESRR